MKKVILERIYQDSETLGVFYVETDPSVHYASLELPWKDNETDVSCIPEGEYTVTRTYSKSFKKKTWEVQNVTDRTGIRIHSANYVSQLKGCIALGRQFKDLNKDGKIDVQNSVNAINEAYKAIGDEFKLIIKKKI